jgi:hypothetical protein
MTVEEAGAVIDRFLATYAGVARWQREQEMLTKPEVIRSTAGTR